MLQLNKGEYSPELADIFVRFLTQYKYPVAVIYGNPDTGKTDTGILLAEIGLNEGCTDVFASNIKTSVGQRITSLEEVKIWHRNQPGKKLYVLDEAAINDDARNPFSKLNREIRHEIFIARHFKVHWVFILQEIKDVDTWKNSTLTGMIIKKDVRDKRYSAKIRVNWESDLIPVPDFPRTTLDFDTYDVAPFTYDKQLNTAGLTIQGEAADIARLLKKTHSSDKVAAEMEQTTGERWTRTDVMNKLYQFLDHLDF